MSEMATRPDGGQSYASAQGPHAGATTIRVQSMAVVRPRSTRPNGGVRLTAWVIRFLIGATTLMAFWDLVLLATHSHT